MKTILIITLTAILLSCAPKESEQKIKLEDNEPSTEVAEKNQKEKQNSNDNISSPGEETDKILGNWIRPDGGYILEIKKQDKGGSSKNLE